MLINAKHKLMKLRVLLELVDPPAAWRLQIFLLLNVLLSISTRWYCICGLLGVPTLTKHPRLVSFVCELLFWCRSAEDSVTSLLVIASGAIVMLVPRGRPLLETVLHIAALN